MSMNGKSAPQQGFVALRRRYRNRARTVLQSTQLTEPLDRLQEEWNGTWGRYRISPGTAMPLSLKPDALMTGLYLPASLSEDLERSHLHTLRRAAMSPEAAEKDPALQRDILAFRARADFAILVQRACESIWPPEYFRYRPDDFHVGVGVASVALVFGPRGAIPRLNDLLPPFELGIQSLPYRPTADDQMAVARLEGERDFLMAKLREMLIDDLDEHDEPYPDHLDLDDIEDEMKDHGRRREAERYPDGYHQIAPPDRFWFLQLVEGLSAKDIRDSAGQVQRHAELVFAAKSLAQIARALATNGSSPKDIADLLGSDRVSVGRWLEPAKRTVRRSTKPSPKSQVIAFRRSDVG